MYVWVVLFFVIHLNFGDIVYYITQSSNFLNNCIKSFGQSNSNSQTHPHLDSRILNSKAVDTEKTKTWNRWRTNSGVRQDEGKWLRQKVEKTKRVAGWGSGNGVGEGKDAPCCSSRVMDPSCLFTTDEGESGTQMRPTKHWTKRSNVRAHTG